VRPPLHLTRRTAALTGAAVLGVVALLAVLLLGGGRSELRATAVGASSSAPSSAPSSAATTSVPAPAVTTQATPTPAASEAPRGSSVRLEVPSVGLAVGVLPLTPKAGVIDPPTMADSYWVEPYGEPGGASDNTVYIAGHSWTRGAAAFNALMPGDHGEGVSAGDVVEVQSPGGSVDYTITRTELYDKDALPDATDVWTVAPGRLVLITCFVDDGGRATDDNFVVFAES
jgi:sortase (surface protein transpeptidase)